MKRYDSEQMYRMWRENGDEVDRDCVKRDLERLRENWRTRAKSKENWRLVIDNLVGQK